VLPGAAPAPAIRRFKKALDNLALAATNDTVVLQQLTAANLALTATIGTLTAANKTLADAVARGGGTATPGTPAPVGTSGGRVKSTTKPHPGNYCWTHGHCISKSHTSATCANKGTGHRDDATAANTYGGSEKEKGWDSSRN
jgi:hypothetical protein